MKKILLTLLAIISLASCSSDDATAINEPSPTATEQTKSYRFFPMAYDASLYHMPITLTTNDMYFAIKRGNGEWVEQPVSYHDITVQQNDSVWFKVIPADGYYPNEKNFMDFQIWNKDTLAQNSGNTKVRFETYNAPINKKVKLEFPEYY